MSNAIKCFQKSNTKFDTITKCCIFHIFNYFGYYILARNQPNLISHLNINPYNLLSLPPHHWKGKTTESIKNSLDKSRNLNNIHYTHDWTLVLKLPYTLNERIHKCDESFSINILDSNTWCRYFPMSLAVVLYFTYFYYLLLDLWRNTYVGPGNLRGV